MYRDLTQSYKSIRENFVFYHKSHPLNRETFAFIRKAFSIIRDKFFFTYENKVNGRSFDSTHSFTLNKKNNLISLVDPAA